MKKVHLLAGAILALTASAVLADVQYFPQGSDNARRPAIGADVGPGVRTDSIRLIIDNQDYTGRSSINNNRISFQPDYDIDLGAHSAMISGVNQDGTSFQRNWGFSVTPYGNATYNPNNGYTGYSDYNYKTANNGYSGISQYPQYQYTGNPQYSNVGSGDLSNVFQLTPLPLPGQETGRRPWIGCLVPAGLHPDSFRLIVDGRDFTGAAFQAGNRIAFEPAYDLDLGRHQATFTGSANGQGLEQNWEFYVR